MPDITEADLRAVRDRASLFDFLGHSLGWETGSDDTFTYLLPPQPGLPQGRVEVSRIVPFGAVPFVLMLAEFQTPLRRTDLRKILQGIRRDDRLTYRYGGIGPEEIIFVCPTPDDGGADDYGGVSFAHFEEREGRAPKLEVFGWEEGHIGATRTLREINLKGLQMPERNLLDEYDWLIGRNKWLKAWDVQVVTDQFFSDFREQFQRIERHLRLTAPQGRWAHDSALQLLSRILFIYFIQRKRSTDGSYWVGDDRSFLATFWGTYRHSDQEADTFYSRWLSVFFFEAFNNRFTAGRADYQARFPAQIRTALLSVPYLNGGLFSRNALDDQHQAVIPDRLFASVFEFFDGYNFTITETTPLDIEVAVDPEMIGQVYETLVNVEYGEATEEAQGEAGIFYTQRVEIDLMCRLTLVDYFTRHLGEAHKPLLQRVVFAYEAEERTDADQEVLAANLWEPLHHLLRNVTVCDPACGSGSFLVGMLLVLDDLQSRANSVLGEEETAYHRRRRIIGQSLYGVDIMEWAVRVAELRLWLQLAVEADLQPGHLRLHPLLPNLSFKVRHGDSLVQDVGGINFGLHHQRVEVPAPLQGQLTRLKGRKRQFYNGEDPTITEALLRHEEQRLFVEILDRRLRQLEQEIHSLTQAIEAPATQGTLAGMADLPAGGLPTLQRRQRQEREEKQGELAYTQQAREAIRPDAPLPFIWDMAFVEIFEGAPGIRHRHRQPTLCAVWQDQRHAGPVRGGGVQGEAANGGRGGLS